MYLYKYSLISIFNRTSSTYITFYKLKRIIIYNYNITYNYVIKLILIGSPNNNEFIFHT